MVLKAGSCFFELSVFIDKKHILKTCIKLKQINKNVPSQTGCFYNLGRTLNYYSGCQKVIMMQLPISYISKNYGRNWWHLIIK